MHLVKMLLIIIEHKILIELSKAFNGNEILKIFSQMMDKEVAHIKIAILARVKKIAGDKKIINAIFQKGRIDSHFGVRRIAEEYNEDLVEI